MTSHASTAEVAETLRNGMRATESYFLGLPIKKLAKTYFDFVTETAFAEGAEPHLDSREGKVSAGMVRLPHAAQQELAFAAQDVAVRNLWQRGRIVYPIDSDAWESIGAASPSSTIPPTTLHTLPHPDPLLVFPKPILLDHEDKERQRVVGVYVNGTRARADGKGEVPCSTHHAAVQGWTMTFAGLVEDRDGRPVMYDAKTRDIMWTRTTVRLGEKTTLGSLAEGALERFNAIQGHLAFGRHREDLPLLLSRAINMLIYLGAVNADLQPLPATAPRPRMSGRGKAAELEVVQVGYRVGAQLRAWQERLEQERGPGTGKTVKPHIRRSHDHTFRYGPGRRQSYVKWLWPIPVNMGPNGATETTIIPVKEES
jgi:hypothetical protein